MGGLVDTFFGPGGGGIETPKQGKVLKKLPKTFGLLTEGIEGGTQFSGLDPRTGRLSLDPTGRNLRLGGLETFGERLGETRESLLGNQGAFVNARVRPLVERLTAGRGALRRGLGRTGVRGTFANQALQDFDIRAGRAEGDARAIAEAETLNAITALDKALFSGQAGVGQQLAGEELKALGLSSNAIQSLQQIASGLLQGTTGANVQAQTAQAAADTTRAQNLLGFIGSGSEAAGSVLSGGVA